MSDNLKLTLMFLLGVIVSGAILFSECTRLQGKLDKLEKIHTKTVADCAEAWLKEK